MHVDGSGRGQATDDGSQLDAGPAHSRAADGHPEAVSRRFVRRGDDPHEAARDQAPLCRFAQASGMDGEWDVRFRGSPSGELTVESRCPGSHQQTVPPAHAAQTESGALFEHNDRRRHPGDPFVSIPLVTINGIMVVT